MHDLPTVYEDAMQTRLENRWGCSRLVPDIIIRPFTLADELV